MTLFMNPLPDERLMRCIHFLHFLFCLHSHREIAILTISHSKHYDVRIDTNCELLYIPGYIQFRPTVNGKMRFIQQAKNIHVRNFDDIVSSDQLQTRKHGTLLPNSIRCIIAGPSNCGKTNLLISLIESENGLSFENIYIYSKTLQQDKYKYLEYLLKPIKSVGFFKFLSSDQVIHPNKMRKNSLIIFDDVICEKKQENIKSFFCLGRHRNIDCFYLTQTYARVSKHMIRDNCNFLILFKQDDMNLKHVFDDMGIACDMKFNEFRLFCSICWRAKYGFVVIDLDSDVNNGRYRKGFASYLKI